MAEVTRIIKVVIRAVDSVSAVFKKIGGNAAMLAAGVGLVAAGIGIALTAALAKAVKATDDYKEAAENLDNSLTRLQKAIGGPIAKVLRVFIEDGLIPIIDKFSTGIEKSTTFAETVRNLGIALARVGQISEKLVRAKLIPDESEANQYLEKMRLLAIAVRGYNAATMVSVASVAAFIDHLESPVFDNIIEKLEKLDFSLQGTKDSTDAVRDSFDEWLTVSAEGMVRLEEMVNTLAEEGLPVLQAQTMENVNGVLRYKENIESLGAAIHRSLREIGVGAAAAFGDVLVDAAMSGKMAFADFFKQLLKDLVRAILRALMLRAILSAVGFAFPGGGGQLASVGIMTIPGFGNMFVPGMGGGKGASPLSATQMEGAFGGAGLAMQIEMGPNMAKLADSLTVDVRDGRARLLASGVANARTVR